MWKFTYANFFNFRIEWLQRRRHINVELYKCGSFVRYTRYFNCICMMIFSVAASFKLLSAHILLLFCARNAGALDFRCAMCTLLYHSFATWVCTMIVTFACVKTWLFHYAPSNHEFIIVSAFARVSIIISHLFAFHTWCAHCVRSVRILNYG